MRSSFNGKLSTENGTFSGNILSNDNALNGAIYAEEKILQGTLETAYILKGSLQEDNDILKGSLSFGYTKPTNEYVGDYEVTPNEDEQILLTAQKHLNKNIVVKPIPSNYGKISWNGAVLTIS